MLDRHCHILYGIDDGAPDREASLAMLRAAKAAGVTRIVATPHVRDTAFDVVLAKERKHELEAYAQESGIALELGYELHWRALSMAGFEAAGRYCRENTDELLIEFSLAGELPGNMMKGIFALQRAGLQVIIAHPERYRCVQKNIALAREWIYMGCQLQLDANMLVAPVIEPARLCAAKLLKQGLYQHYASDAHCARDYALFARVVKRVGHHFGDEKQHAAE